MAKIGSELHEKLKSVNYFNREEILVKNIILRKPNAILFDWENTIVQRKQDLNNYRGVLFELTDVKIIKLLV